MIDTPMGCDRSTKTIFINPKLYSKLTPFEKKFWTWHEKGHIVLDTSDEIAADNYAFDKLAGTEYRSLKQMIEAAESLLDSGHFGHESRIDNLYNRAIQWDKEHPEQKIDKATAKFVDRMGTQFNNLVLTMGTLMNTQTQTTFQGTQTKDNSLYILIIAIIMVVIVLKLLDKK